MITIDSVSVRFGRAKAVDGVSLSIGRGDSVALWGVNGAGKTTLIRSVLGLLRFEGRIEVGGHDVRRSGKCARMLVGYVPQEQGFYDDLRVSEAVAFFGSLKGLGRGAWGGALEGVGLAGQDGKRVRELSGGMKQRLALAIALLGDPAVLVLDEVTASLDACGREEFVELLRRLRGEGRTMLFASHRVDEVSTLATRVATLEAGRLASVCASVEFGARLGGSSVLHVRVNGEDRVRALAALRGAGLDARENGVGVLATVPAGQKGAAMRALGEARVAFDDFEVLPAVGAKGVTR